jgi:hypothetical protein
MKKIIFSLAFSAALLSSGLVHAADIEPGAKVKYAFTQVFSKAGAVEWTNMEKEGVYQASFVIDNETMKAFFTEEGDFLGTTRQIVAKQLPIMVTNELDKQYTDARIISIFEYSKKDGLDYYITLTGKKGALIVKATGNGDLSVYKKNLK